MKRSRKQRPESRDRQLAILDAAARAIAAHGFHGMSMRALAKATGQSLAAFYNHFASKDEVLYRIQAQAFESLVATAQDVVAGMATAEDRLFAFIYQHVRYVAEHPDVMRVLVHEAGALAPSRRAAVRDLKERYFGIGRAIVEELYARGRQADPLDVERATYGVFGMLNWVYGWYQPSRHGSPGAVARSLHKLAMCGVVTECPVQMIQAQGSVERKLAVLRPVPLLGARAEERR